MWGTHHDTNMHAQRCAIAGRGLNGGVYASVWRCRRARDSVTRLLRNTSCALTVVFDRTVWQASRRRARPSSEWWCEDLVQPQVRARPSRACPRACHRR